jgi:excisionase family DNA binding protein
MIDSRVTVFLPFTATTPDQLHDAIDAAFRNVNQSPAAPQPAPDSPDAPIVLRSRDVARLLSLSETTVRDLAARGELPSFKLGGSRCFYRHELVAWVEETIAAQRNGGAR